ncbi:hypothetical protein HanXRQr2_Chr15g0682741 [Helianthus annuus]|uniref:Uncharacterized protein n=1 Tax=Helianthus annuus TaxID=4232 RepID=A0A9K3E0A3_HELAN|nr:hypothetical protein HanXRQr2_Chr15g0682741 [Helianthus annuus]
MFTITSFEGKKTLFVSSKSDEQQLKFSIFIKIKEDHVWKKRVAEHMGFF